MVAGGIETIVKAISTHVGNPNVCRNGCNALKCMIENNGKDGIKILEKAQQKLIWTDENKVKAVSAGGVEAVVKAINIHISYADVCKLGCDILKDMTENNGKT